MKYMHYLLMGCLLTQNALHCSIELFTRSAVIKKCAATLFPRAKTFFNQQPSHVDTCSHALAAETAHHAISSTFSHCVDQEHEFLSTAPFKYGPPVKVWPKYSGCYAVEESTNSCEQSAVELKNAIEYHNALMHTIMNKSEIYYGIPIHLFTNAFSRSETTTLGPILAMRRVISDTLRCKSSKSHLNVMKIFEKELDGETFCEADLCQAFLNCTLEYGAQYINPVLKQYGKEETW